MAFTFIHNSIAMCLAFVKAFHVNQGTPLGVVMVVHETVFPGSVNLVTIATFFTQPLIARRTQQSRRRRSVLPVTRMAQIANSSPYLVLFKSTVQRLPKSSSGHGVCWFKLGLYMSMHIIKQDLFLVLAFSYFNYKQSNEHVYTLDHCMEAQTNILLTPLNQTTTLFVTGT